jgi:hypothetical protein
VDQFILDQLGRQVNTPADLASLVAAKTGWERETGGVMGSIVSPIAPEQSVTKWNILQRG